MAELKGTAGELADTVEGRRTAAELPHRELSRADFLRTLFRALDEQAIRYCVLHSYEGLPDELPTDLDLAVHPQDAAKLPFVFQTLSGKGYRPVQCWNYDVNSYQFIFSWFEARVANFIVIDIVYEYRHGALFLTSGKSLVAGRQKQGDFWIPDASTEFAYLLAKKTIKGSVRGHQRQRLKRLVEEVGPHEAERVARNLFGKRWSKLVVEGCANGSLGSLLGKLKKMLWLTNLKRDPLNRVRYLLAEVLRVICRWLQPTGLLVAVLGPDGVGKSTLIEHFTKLVSPAFRRQQLFHWRPMLLWRGSHIGPVTDPHGQPRHPAWLSVARLFAHLLDYWFGYWLVIRPLLARSGLVVFDRYFNDILVDPRRYRYGGPLRLAKGLCSLIPKPHLVLLLDAPKEVILSRKQEVGPEEVERQRRTYLKTLDAFSPTGVIDTSRPLLQVGTDAARTVIEYLDSRFQRRHASWLIPRGEQYQRARLESHVSGAPREDVLQRALNEFIGRVQGLTPTIHRNGWPSKNEAVPPVISVVPPGRGPDKPAEQDYARIHRFIVLPSRRSPRWLLPITSNQKTDRTFQIYTPYTSTGRILKNLFVGLIDISWEGWPRRKVLVATGEPLPLESLVREATGESQPVFTFSLGTPGRYRKLTLQVMRPDGEILGYLKLPLTEAATERVRHEAEALERLSNFLALRPHIPRILYTGKWEDGYVLFQSGGPRRQGPVAFGAVHEKFLQALWSVHRVERPGHAVVEEVASRWRTVEPFLSAEWRKLGGKALERASQQLDQVMIRCGIMHGDFAPWNTRLENGQLFVFDWESASWDAPNLWDTFHFKVQVCAFLNSRNGRGFPLGRNRGEEASFLLCLLSSLCRSLEEATGNHAGVKYCKRLLAGALT